ATASRADSTSAFGSLYLFCAACRAPEAQPNGSNPEPRLSLPRPVSGGGDGAGPGCGPGVGLGVGVVAAPPPPSSTMWPSHSLKLIGLPLASPYRFWVSGSTESERLDSPP